MLRQTLLHMIYPNFAPGFIQPLLKSVLRNIVSSLASQAPNFAGLDYADIISSKLSSKC